MSKVIAITSDFDSFAAAQLRAVAASLGYKGEIIENHSVSSFSVIEGAFQISLLTKHLPIGAIHLGIIDPGVGSKRKGIIIKTDKYWFIGPDNGLLYPALCNYIIEKGWQIKESEVSDNVSNTFHGRDIFIKAAVYIAKGIDPEHFGCTKIKSKSIKSLFFKDGQVLHIDNYGNIKVFWNKKIRLGKKLVIRTKQSIVEFPIVKTFSDVSPGSPLAYLGSSNILELAVNLGNASQVYRINKDDILDIDFLK